MDKQSTLQRQIRRRMDLLGISTAKLERDAKLPEGRVKNILQGKSRSPRMDTIQSIARALGCAVIDLTELTDDISFTPDDPELPPQEESNQGRDSTISVAELDVRASAGAGTLIDGHETLAQWQLPSHLVRGITATPEPALKFIRVVGDSMQPTLTPGQRVMVDTDDRTPSPPGVFVVWDGLGFVVKRVELIAHSEPLAVRIMSDNPRYSPYERTLEEAFIQGRVIGGWVWI